jgi:hypothetical protein
MTPMVSGYHEDEKRWGQHPMLVALTRKKWWFFMPFVGCYGGDEKQSRSTPFLVSISLSSRVW